MSERENVQCCVYVAVVSDSTLKGATRVRFKVARAGSIKQLVTEFSLDINDALMRSACLLYTSPSPRD